MARVLTAESARLARVAAGRGDPDATKGRVLARVLGGRSYEEVGGAGTEYGARLARAKISPEMRARLEWHRGQGHELVIVSASLDVYLHEVARVLAVDDTLCTTLHIDAGTCTGGLVGKNCRGPEKAERLRALFGADDVELWAYGDSSGDREMLALADHPFRARGGRLTGA